jgi:glycosyltransferase involved in cell wall biosynthesis
LQVNVNSYHLPQAERVQAMTQFLKKWYVDRGIAPAERVDLVPIFLKERDVRPANPKPRRIGFIAKDFVAKGGPTLLRAFTEVLKTRPDAELILVGSPQPSDASASPQVQWMPYIEREKLLGESSRASMFSPIPPSSTDYRWS